MYKSKSENIIKFMSENYPNYDFIFEYYDSFSSTKKYEEKKLLDLESCENELIITIKEILAGNVIQIMEVDGVSYFYHEYCYIVDFNYDGYDDIIILNSIQGNHEYYYCYIWNEIANRFENIDADLWDMPKIIVDIK